VQIARHFGECAIPVIVAKEILATEIGDIKVGKPIIVIVNPGCPLSKGNAVHAGNVTYLGEGSVPVVVKELGRGILISNKQVQEFVVVEVRPGRHLARCNRGATPAWAVLPVNVPSPLFLNNECRGGFATNLGGYRCPTNHHC
jgi:hypothetical protein